uniref:Uncharacterized protein n=1 Tax=Atrato Chu-like virus 4 TaxID=2689324 RepID=A0A6B9KU96_9VIRU|nr:hypothetical protein [Atrato Chu-like virus 4]
MAGLEKRVGVTPTQFIQEDKFETALNLMPLLECQDKLKSYLTWQEYLASGPLHPWLRADAVNDFNFMGFSITEVSELLVSPLLPAYIVKHILSHSQITSHLTQKAYREFHTRTVKITKASLKIQINHVLSNCRGELRQSLLTAHNIWPDKLDSIPVQCLNASSVSEDLLMVLNELKRMQQYIKDPNVSARMAKRHRGEPKPTILKSLAGKVWIMKSFLVFECFSKTWLVPHDYFLEIYNKAVELHSVLMYAHFVSGTTLPENSYQETCNFLKLLVNRMTSLAGRSLEGNLDHQRERLALDNRGFTLLKTMEAIGIGVIMMRY